MQKNYTKPPDCCVIMEMEQGVYLGYRKAVLLNEIEALGSLSKAAKTSYIDETHARDLIFAMNRDFSQPLIFFHGEPRTTDNVQLSAKGQEIVQLYWRQFEPVWLSIIEERRRHY